MMQCSSPGSIVHDYVDLVTALNTDFNVVL